MITLCINLDSRPDRWEEAEAEFARVKLSVQRFAACTGGNPVRAFNRSVYECMKLAQGGGLILFEDDVVFDGSPCELFPKDALTVHFGCNIIGVDTTDWKMPTRYNDSFAVLHNCWQSHATYYSAECVQFIIDNFPYWKDEYEREGCMIFDEWLRVNVLPMGRSYVTNPMVAYQRPSKSDIWGHHADYTGAHKQGNEYLKQLR